MRIWILFILLVCSSLKAFGQCTTEGQTPSTAFPVCATAVFHQDKVPACVNHSIPVPGCDRARADYSDDSPFWYRFTCFKSGTLGLLIEPENKTDDYDWELFDITGHDPKEVYTDASLVVNGNWAGVPGNTGASSEGKSSMSCASSRDASRTLLFSKMPHIEKGHEYLLLVSHYSGSTQSGYDLSFEGGSASITDTTTPEIKKAAMLCNGKSMTVYLNKEMKCSSLESDGSDFEIPHANVAIKSVEGEGCKNGFGMQQLTLNLTGRIAPGSYYLKIRKGKDGNTLLDNCGTAVEEGDSVSFEYHAPEPVGMDSITDVGCKPKDVVVVFSELIKNNSVAGDGSDFKIKNVNTGKILNITAAESLHETQNLSTSFRIYMGKTIYEKGRYQVFLQKGSDGNTVISECDIPSLAGQSLTFQTADTVRAKINKTFHYYCNKVAVVLSNPGGNEINHWRWKADSVFWGDDAKIEYKDSTFQSKNFELEVDNGVCKDKRKMEVVPDSNYYVHADFLSPAFVCPQDQVILEDKSKGGHIVHWRWSYGNGRSSFKETPTAFKYPVTRSTREYPVQLIVVNSKNCRDTMVKKIKVINTCEVYIPTAFSPNGDGNNDKLYPLNAYLADDLDFCVYNRYGQKVYQTRDWTKGWDGTYKGKKQPTGAYVWTLRFVNSRTEKEVFRKGATLLIR